MKTLEINYSNMFRSHWTIILEHVYPSQSYHRSLIFYVTLWCCGSMLVWAFRLCLYSPVDAYPALLCLVLSIARYNSENTNLTSMLCTVDCDRFSVTKHLRTAVRFRLMNQFPDGLHVQTHSFVVMKGLNFKKRIIIYHNTL